MAGSYPDVPGHRLQYQVDGSIVYNHTNVGAISPPPPTWTPFTQQQLNDLNDEDASPDVYSVTNNYIFPRFTAVFSRPIDISGIYLAASGAGSGAWSAYWSNDTIGGEDGTWTGFTLQYPVASGYNAGAWRANIQSVNFVAARGLRFVGPYGGSNTTATFGNLHIYGEYASDGLELWHPTLDQKISGAHLDWGDVVRGLIYQKQFRVKNLSSLTANTITISSSAQSNPSPTLTSQIDFAVGAGPWTAAPTIASLAPGATSELVTCRLSVSTNAQLAAWAGVLNAIAGSWS